MEKSEGWKSATKTIRNLNHRLLIQSDFILLNYETKILLLSFLFLSLIGYAQPIDWNKKLPADPNVLIGKLPNGITYYLRHNEEPKDRASFFIIRNAGALLENDDQDGLAHFLEHMAFNGSKNFPGNSMISTLERHGISFGGNLNAYTTHRTKRFITSAMCRWQTKA